MPNPALVEFEFNIAGPCIAGEHYMIPPERRLGDVLRLIRRRKFFSLYAGRQTGKTTSLKWLEEHFNKTETWRALWVDLQTAQGEPDPAKAFRTILERLERTCARRFPDIRRLDIDELLRDPKSALGKYLTHLASVDARPWVLFFDEVDGLVGDAMVSFLTQLREGYVARSQVPFPASVMLVGQREVRDYVTSREGLRAISWLGTTSPFNITAESMTLEPFAAGEVEELLVQHTTATGQKFAPEAIARIYELGRGHPWLTNALADQITRRDVPDRNVPITSAHVDAAKETIILERRTHIDSLVAKLREDRVRRLIDPMLAGQQTSVDVLDDDFSYVVGLGLIRKHQGLFEIANPIYREVIPRSLTYVRQGQIARWQAHVLPDGSLDMDSLMRDWQEFWREDGHLAADGFGYRESGPHLMLMAFLQRIINGGGRIGREYGLGRGALDLLVEWKDKRHAIEVKIRRDAETQGKAVQQLGRYLDSLGLREGWLVLFDLRKQQSWKKKLFVRKVKHEGKRITVVGS